jgi:hypothetical protein
MTASWSLGAKKSLFFERSVPALGGPSRSGRLLKHGATWEARGPKKISRFLRLYSISIGL